jgi:hypothetical protein
MSIYQDYDGNIKLDSEKMDTDSFLKEIRASSTKSISQMHNQDEMKQSSFKIKKDLDSIRKDLHNHKKNINDKLSFIKGILDHLSS